MQHRCSEEPPILASCASDVNCIFRDGSGLLDWVCPASLSLCLMCPGSRLCPHRAHGSALSALGHSQPGVSHMDTTPMPCTPMGLFLLFGWACFQRWDYALLMRAFPKPSTEQQPKKCDGRKKKVGTRNPTGLDIFSGQER